MVTQQFDQQFVPEELRMSSNMEDLAIGNESSLFSMYLILRKWLELPADLTLLNRDGSLPAAWTQGQVLELPKDRKYQNCILKLNSRANARALEIAEANEMPENQIVMQLVMMTDPIWLCLFKADFTDKKTVRGNLRAKMRIQDFESIEIDKVELKKLNFVFHIEGQDPVKGSCYFDTPAAAIQTRDFMIFNKGQVPLRAAERVEQWL